jgi:serine/threonine protein kinase
VLTLKDLRPGAVLGRYEILARVAQGGMAAVWAARQKGSHGFSRLVAVKTMLPELCDDEDFEDMFLDESRLASRIRHPHVVEIVDIGEENGWLYLVMQWVDGETLFAINRASKGKERMPLPILLKVASAVAAALHAAHELRDDRGQLVDLVHRDVSPQNVMVGYDGIVKLIDFGVAKAKGRTHQTKVGGPMKGKVPYLSPEQVLGNKVDRRSDIFALGILLYSTISGRHPFKGDTDARTMENLCTREAVPLSSIVPDVHPELDAIVLRALHKSPAERFQTAADMQRALDDLLAKLGRSVNEGDIAQWVRATLGPEYVEARHREITSAIERLDAEPSARGAASSAPPKAPPRAPSSAPRAVDRAHSSRPPPRPGDAALDGVLPISLGELHAPLVAPSKVPSVAPVPTATFKKRSSSTLLYVLITLLFLSVAAGIVAFKMGLLG